MQIINKNLSKIIFLASAAILVLIFVSMLLYLKIQGESKNIADQLYQIAVLEKKEKDFSGSRQSLKDFDGEISALQKTLLSEKEFVDFVKTLESVAQKTGVKFKAENATLPGSPVGASISFTIDGDFASIAKFFVLLDNLQYSGILDNVSIAPVSENSKTIRAAANFIIFNFRSI